MKTKQQHLLAKRKQKIAQRLVPNKAPQPSQPMLQGINVDYQLSDRIRAISAGGIGAMHPLVERLGLRAAINERLALFKRHVPYGESDHILTLCYNVLSGGTCLQDLELLRQDATYLNALDVGRLPDPTTAGDFLRRFHAEDVITLLDVINHTRQTVWRQTAGRLGKTAILDVDGTICATAAECKHGIAYSYTGVWGYAPLVITLANTKEVLYLGNRPGHVPSHQAAADYIDHALALTKSQFDQVYLRGDTAFSLTAHLDRWDTQCTFVLGLDAMPNLVRIATTLTEYHPLLRLPPYTVKTKPRTKPDHSKAQRVKARQFKTLTLVAEDVAEFTYRPGQCQKPYRVIVLRKHLRITKGGQVLGTELRFFFYITNDGQMTPAQLVRFANGRCDQENVLAQLKHGLHALRMPVRDLISNWAYMVCAALAWNLKAWYGLFCPDPLRWREIVRSFVASSRPFSRSRARSSRPGGGFSIASSISRSILRFFWKPSAISNVSALPDAFVSGAGRGGNPTPVT